MKHFLVDSNDAMRVLQGFNPWWSQRPHKVPSFRRVGFAACRALLRQNLRRAILLSGPRRVGKTTLLLQLAAEFVREGHEPKQIVYISLDHPILKLLTLSEALRLYHEVIHPAGVKTILLLDEVQYSRDWATEIKLLVDHHPEYTIIATGSASIVQHHTLAESGVGRWVTLSIPTLSFYEFMQIQKHEHPPTFATLKPTQLFHLSKSEQFDISSQMRPLLPYFHRYMLIGGFPETAQLEDIVLAQRLVREDVVDRVLKRDMATLFSVRHVEELERVFIYLCLHTGSIMNHTSLAQALETSPVTVSNYLRLLEQANLIYRLTPFEMGGKKILKARNKYHIVDAALRNATLLSGEEILTDSTELGSIVETAVLRHLYAFYYRDTPRISYWRDAKTEKEVDMIVSSPKYTFPFEVKYKEHARIEATDGLVLFCKAEQLKQAFVITKNEHDFVVSHHNDIQVAHIPAHIFLYLLGCAEQQLWVS